MGRAKGIIAGDQFQALFGKRGDPKAFNLNHPAPSLKDRARIQQMIDGLEPLDSPSDYYMWSGEIIASLMSLLTELETHAPLYKEAPLVDKLLGDIATTLAEGLDSQWASIANKVADEIGIRSGIDSLTLVTHDRTSHVWPDGILPLRTVDNPLSSHTLCDIPFTLYADDWERAPRGTFFIDGEESCSVCAEKAARQPEMFPEVYETDDKPNGRWSRSFLWTESDKKTWQQVIHNNLKANLLALVNGNKSVADWDIDKSVHASIRRAYADALAAAAEKHSADVLYHALSWSSAVTDRPTFNNLQDNPDELQRLAAMFSKADWYYIINQTMPSVPGQRTDRGMAALNVIEAASVKLGQKSAV